MTTSPKTALITGITGQDGSYLAELLLTKGYRVIGLVSANHSVGDQNIASIAQQLELIPGDLQDSASLESIVKTVKPDEIYNLGGLSFPPASWEKPTLTLDINTLGVTRLLEIIHLQSPQTKFFQASSCKMFGQPETSPQLETTPIRPLDPYSASKAAAHFIATQFRAHFNLFISCGIMYNHESVRRGPEFVTRKITTAAAQIKLGQTNHLTLGNLEAEADWGYAPDYVEAMWQMLQQETPDDYIIASGTGHHVKDIAQISFSHLGLDYTQYVSSDPNLFQAQGPHPLVGDISKIKAQLGWQPQTDFESMIVKMVDHDLQSISNKHP